MTLPFASHHWPAVTAYAHIGFVLGLISACASCLMVILQAERRGGFWGGALSLPAAFVTSCLVLLATWAAWPIMAPLMVLLCIRAYFQMAPGQSFFKVRDE